jgi:Fic family protein
MGGRWIEMTWQHEPRSPAPRKYRRACRYQAYIPDPLSALDLTLGGELAGVVSEAEAAVQDLNASARPALAPLARLLLRTESIASSKVEGMQMGVRQLARAEAKLESGGKAGSTAEEILANIDAMQLAIDEAAGAARFGRAELEAIHCQLMEGSANPRIASRIREEQNWIGGNDYNPCGADFVPPPPEHVPGLLDDLFDAMEDDRLPPLVQAALVHAQFETIHPFHDGNGRTGRALIHVVLNRRGIAPEYVPPISVVLANNRDRYIAGLTAYREDDVDRWIGHFAAATAASATLASEYLRAVAELTAQWKSALSKLPSAPRSDAAAWAIIEVLPAHPIITAPVAAAATGRAKPRVYQGLESLQEAAVLLPVTRKRRNQAWEADGLLSLLEGLEAGERPRAGAR